jgi:hypothetical protein
MLRILRSSVDNPMLSAPELFAWFEVDLVSLVVGDNVDDKWRKLVGEAG